MLSTIKEANIIGIIVADFAGEIITTQNKPFWSVIASNSQEIILHQGRVLQWLVVNLITVIYHRIYLSPQPSDLSQKPQNEQRKERFHRSFKKASIYSPDLPFALQTYEQFNELIQILMGACSSGGSQPHRPKGQSIQTIPSGTQQLKNIALPVLSFFVLLSDIKIKKCFPVDLLSVRFRIEGIDEFETASREPDRMGRAYWKINHSFDFFLNQYQLRQKFLRVDVIGKQRELLGSLRMNVFSLWVGPYHLDFKIPLKGAQNSRISFNFKISQGVHLRIINTETEMLPLKQRFNDQRFTFSFQSVIGQQLEEVACPYVVCLKEKEQKYGKMEAEDTPVQTYFVSKEKILWSQSTARSHPLPSFEKTIAYYEIYAASLRLSFFRVLPGLTNPLQFRYETQSECFIPLTKLMTIDYVQNVDSQTNITYFQRTAEVVQKTWLHGKQTGSARVKLKFSIQTHLKQMQTCVRTEEGILTSSPVFSTAGDKPECVEIQGLKKVKQDVQREFINLDNNEQHKSNIIMIKENLLRINDLLCKALALLEKSSKESTLFYEYKNQQELHSSQRFLIDLAFKVLSFIHEDKPEICEISWSILSAILKRGEFKLSHLGFSQPQREQLASKDTSDSLRQKVQIALKYQQLLNQLLKETLFQLEYKGDEAEQNFAQSFCSYAFFRIPLFREHILSVLKREDDPELTEWRGTQADLTQQSNRSIDFSSGDDFYGIHFDWENNFYKSIAREERYRLSNSELQTILLSEKWKIRLAKRRGAFFTFFYNLLSQIEYVSVVSKYIKWYQLPGYNRLLLAFLIEMKQTKIKNYSQRLKKCLIKSLSNQKLINIFVVILMKKTNVHDVEAVEASLSLIDQFFAEITLKSRVIPTTFDYKYFLEGLKLVLESELDFSISRALILIYNHLYVFAQEFALELCLFILSKCFFKFLFHWSYNLRHIFHTVLAVRVVRFIEERKKQQSPQKRNSQNHYTNYLKEAIKERYDGLMAVLTRNIEPNIHFSKQLYSEQQTYKKMRHKLGKNRGKQQQPECSLAELISLPLLVSRSSSRELKPVKFVYFQESDMEVDPPTENQLRYAPIALEEFKCISEEMAKLPRSDSKDVPEIKVKRVADEKQYGPILIQQW